MSLLNGYSDIQVFNLWAWEHKPPCRTNGCSNQAVFEIIDPRMLVQNTRVAYYCQSCKEVLGKKHGNDITVSTK